MKWLYHCLGRVQDDHFSVVQKEVEEIKKNSEYAELLYTENQRIIWFSITVIINAEDEDDFEILRKDIEKGLHDFMNPSSWKQLS